MARPQLVAALLGWMALLFVLEQVSPLRARTRGLVSRLIVNCGVSAIAFVAAWLLVRPAIERSLHFVSVRPFGFLYLAHLPAPGRWLLAFLLMDLSFYWWHRANHRIGFLWRFHNVHHIDPDLDVSTAFRFHFGEVALSSAFRAAQVAVIGPTVAMFAAYELVFQVATAFHHSNLRLPIGLDRLLNLMTVTPRMHGIHHSQLREQTNSNYSVVFSWWDRAHRTFRADVPQSEITVGVPGYSGPHDNTLLNSLLSPFRKQRPYWPAA
jgi:sterol desaturase/sphingolipid hydroxylase (fatty acid hydroxylase superfamily)